MHAPLIRAINDERKPLSFSEIVRRTGIGQTRTVVVHSIKKCGLPPGVFALLFGADFDIGATLVDPPTVKAVGFTGSLSASKPLMQRAAARPEPIPCFMEMSSVNPVFVLPEALRTRARQIAVGLFGSFTRCWTVLHKAGTAVVPRNEEADVLVAELKAQVEKAAIWPMLTEGISKSYRSGIGRQKNRECVETLGQATSNGADSSYATPVIMQIGASDLLRDPELATEVFVPSTLVIRYESREAMLALARRSKDN